MAETLKLKFMNMQCAEDDCYTKAVAVHKFDKRLVCDDHLEMDSDSRRFIDISASWKRKEKLLDELEVSIAKHQVSFQLLQSGHIKFKEGEAEHTEFYKVALKIQDLLMKMARDAEDLKETKAIDTFDFIDENVKRVKKLFKDYESLASINTHRWITNLMYNAILKEAEIKSKPSEESKERISGQQLPEAALNSEFSLCVTGSSLSKFKNIEARLEQFNELISEYDLTVEKLNELEKKCHNLDNEIEYLNYQLIADDNLIKRLMPERRALSYKEVNSFIKGIDNRKEFVNKRAYLKLG